MSFKKHQYLLTAICLIGIILLVSVGAVFTTGLTILRINNPTPTVLPSNEPIYYAPLGNQCTPTVPFHDAVLEIHIVTNDEKYIYNGISTHMQEYAFEKIGLPIWSFTIGGHTYSTGATDDWNGICVEAPSSFWWVDKITVSVAGYSTVTFSWHPTSGEHSIIEVVYPQAQIVVKQGNPQIALSP